LFKKEEQVPGSGTTYWKTKKLKEICPKILEFQLPVIDAIVDDYDNHHETR
jgi:hypothetical protein